MANKSEFLSWFRAKAGKPIMTDKEYYTLRDETIPRLQRQLADAKAKLALMERYHVAKQCALYAWTSKPS